ncbi:hypothetical protein ANN_20881 [Periplaneta americana]|uniref:Uncharacterized protein n=1 Tax=Periplaneta americana TaxID=6978 RepID=A0ABQ8SDU6_PERAM|nr:hypothetical protein ANN_20881 [Periplaneta americana]
MSAGSNTESYPAFAHIGLRKNPGKNLNQVTCPNRESNPGHLVSRPDALAVTPQVWTRGYQEQQFLLSKSAQNSSKNSEVTTSNALRHNTRIRAGPRDESGGPTLSRETERLPGLSTGTHSSVGRRPPAVVDESADMGHRTLLLILCGSSLRFDIPVIRPEWRQTNTVLPAMKHSVTNGFLGGLAFTMLAALSEVRGRKSERERWKSELLRNNRHHRVRTSIAEVLKHFGWEVFEEFHCISAANSNRRAYIIAIDRVNDKAMVLDQG